MFRNLPYRNKGGNGNKTSNFEAEVTLSGNVKTGGEILWPVGIFQNKNERIFYADYVILSNHQLNGS